MDTSIEKVLSEHRTDSIFHTHVSMVQPKGRYQFNRQGLENFWDIYCQSMNGVGDPIVGIAEKPHHNYLPVLADIDLKIKEIDGIDLGDHLYTDIQTTRVIEIYQSVLRNIVDECKDEHLICVLLEKPMYRIVQGENSYAKNGFHLHFPYLFLNKVDQEVQVIPRVQELLRNDSVFDDLGFEDSSSIVDKACCKVPWLMYGSRKSEDMEPYLVSKVFDSECNEIDLENAFKYYRLFNERERLIDIKGNIKNYLPRILSIIPYGRETCELKHGLISPLKEKIKAVKDRKPNKVSVVDALAISAQLLPMLADWRAEDRNEWMTIGWILFNIGDASPEALDKWLDFSSRCEEKYDEATCIFEWERMSKKDLTLGTMRYYASVDNPDAYKEFKKEQAVKHAKNALNGSHNDVAKVLFAEYGNEFVCASIANKMWYQFRNHKWEEIENGVFLRERISDDIVQMFVDMGQEAFQEKGSTSGDKGIEAMHDARIKQINKIINNLKSAPYKDNIMKECMEVFYDRRFKEKLDKNPYMIAFMNGVYDLKLNLIRPGRPEDFLSKSLPIDYVEFNDDDEKVHDVHSYLEKVFPDKSVRRYFMDQSSDIFVGGNHQKVVLFWTGEGDNAKSVTQSIFEKMLGELAIKFSTTLITGKKVGNGSANPELARAGDGVRWAVLEEPDGDEQVNIGTMKSLSGNDSYWARDLFEKGKATKEKSPMFKLIFICFSGETEISLSSGVSVSIEKMREKHRLLSWDKKTDGLVKTSQLAFLPKGEQKCITLTLLDGREITCTPNHKFLTTNNEWVQAKDINLHDTQIKMGINNPNCDDIFDIYDYVLNVGNLNFNLANYNERLKASAICRLIGYVITDGSQNKVFHIQNITDANNIVDDIELLTNKRPPITKNKRILQVCLPVKLHTEISKLTPLQKGRKVNHTMILPEFIFNSNCPTFLIREILAGMFGGNGVLRSIVKNQCTMMQLVSSKVEEHPQSLVEMFNRLSVVLSERFGIESVVSDLQGKVKFNVFLRICKNESIISFIEKVGVRYCCNKSYRLMAVISMLRYKRAIVDYNISSVDMGSYLRQTGLDKFVNKGHTNHYSVHPESTSLPCYQMSVINIKDAGVRKVYDINVEEPFSNFIANGAVSHNCNKLPTMKYSDKATWNRIRVIPFESTFVPPGEQCPETYEEQLIQKRFPMDPYFSQKIPDLVQAFAWVLLDHRKKITVRIEPEKVRFATALYRRQNDVYRQFVEECIIEDDASLSLTEMYCQFKEWFKDGFPGQTLPVKNQVKEYFGKLWFEPEKGIKWTGYRIRTIQDDVEDGTCVVLGDEDLVNYDTETGKALPPM
jgi:phage/plasmid-associated DNA primase